MTRRRPLQLDTVVAIRSTIPSHQTQVGTAYANGPQLELEVGSPDLFFVALFVAPAPDVAIIIECSSCLGPVMA